MRAVLPRLLMAERLRLVAVLAAVHFGLGHLAGGNQRVHAILRQALAVLIHAHAQPALSSPYSPQYLW